MQQRTRSTRSVGLVRLCAAAVAMWAGPVWSQTGVSLDAVAARLERVEQANAALQQELNAVRQELAALKQEAATESSTAARIEALEEKVDVDSGRLTEQAQVKVETSQRVPLRLTGMVLFNAFRN